MEQISNGDLIELFFIAQEFVEAQFQYWLSISFAAIVGVFVAGNKLNRQMRYLLICLYLLASALFILRYIGAVGELAFIASEMGNRDLGGTIGGVLTIPIVVVRTLLFLTGLATTIWFLVRGPAEEDHVDA